MNDSKKDTAHETHARWQGIALTQLGYSINLILAFSLTAIGFGVSLWGDKWNLQFCFYAISLFLLSLSIAFGLICTITRLRDFRKTREITKLEKTTSTSTSQKIDELRNSADTLGKCTWRLFWLQLGSFALGFICLAISIAVPIFSGSGVKAAQFVIAHCPSFHAIFQ